MKDISEKSPPKDSLPRKLERKSKKHEPMSDVKQPQDVIQMVITPDLELISFDENGQLKSEPLAKHSTDDLLLVNSFNIHYNEFHRSLKAWIDGDPTMQDTKGNTIILNTAEKYLETIENGITQVKNDSYRNLLIEAKMIIIALIILQMKSDYLIDQSKLTTILQSHKDSFGGWLYINNLKQNKQKAQYKSELKKNIDNLIYEALCTGNFLGCKKLLSKAEFFDQKNSLLVELQNLLQDFFDRTQTFNNKSFVSSTNKKGLSEEDFETVYKNHKEIAFQFYQQLESEPIPDKDLHKLIKSSFGILAGVDKEIESKSKTWLQYLFCYLMYKNPNPRERSLSVLKDDIKENFASKINKNEQQLFEIVLEILSTENPVKIISMLEGVYPPFFTIHIADLFELFLRANNGLPEDEIIQGQLSVFLEQI